MPSINSLILTFSILLLNPINSLVIADEIPESMLGLVAHIPNNSELDEIKEIGFRFLRIDLNWYEIQNTPDSYDFQRIDDLIRQTQQMNFEILASVGYTPRWAARNKQCIARKFGKNGCNAKRFSSMKHWRDFVRVLVDRYGNQIQYWSFWNEPNWEDFFEGGPDDYLQEILIPAAQIVHSAPGQLKVCGPDLAGLRDDSWNGHNGICFLGKCSDRDLRSGKRLMDYRMGVSNETLFRF